MEKEKELLLKTPLVLFHEQLGARMVDFAGWFLPVQYTSIIDEHRQTRTKAGLFDVSHMGEFEVRGAQAGVFLQSLLTNDITRLQPQHCHYTLICNGQGGTVDDCIVYQFSREHYWVVVNASNIAKNFAWFKAHSGRFDVQINDLSAVTAKIDIQGPLAALILSPLVESPLMTLQRFTFVETRFRALEPVKVLVSRTGYTGEDGFEIFMPWEAAGEIWNRLLGSAPDLEPVGLGARDTLRIEACLPLYGHELDEATSPVEAGLGWAVREKAEAYPGKEVLLQQKREGTGKQLYAFEMTDRIVPRPGYPLFFKDAQVGMVTSGCFSPIFNKSLGLGYISLKPALKAGDKIQISIRDNFYEATIVNKPFYKYKGVTTDGQRKSS
jgi:aminomethyltransferase